MSPDYEKISALMASNDIYNTGAELHGMISGQLCSGLSTPQIDLIEQLMTLESEFSPVMVQLIERLGTDTFSQISTDDFTFQPLLPDDEEDISLRVYALGKWCEGFNMGFGCGFGKSDAAILQETREVITDFAKISEIEDSMDDEDEQSEEDYMELVEYVRMAVITVFNQNNANEQDESNIH